MPSVADQPLELGRYRLIEEVARGAGGVVYKARDPLIDRLVTIKTMAVGLPDDEYPEFQRRVERELKSAGRLNHPNIVTIYDVGITGDIAYIAMEFIDGRSLRDMLNSHLCLMPAIAADIAAQVADGLDFVHQRGLVHRNINPDNVMVLRNGVVKITDFGIARPSRGSHTLIAEVVASPRYTSPEQVMGEKVDERSDIFSLGAILYEMLTGVPPFAGGKLHEVAQRIVNEMPLAPSLRNRAVPPAFDSIVANALAKRPDERYRTAREMAGDLRTVAQAPGNAAKAAATAEPPETSQIAQDMNAEGTANDARGGLEQCPLVETPAIDTIRRKRPVALYAAAVLLLTAAAGWALLSGETRGLPDSPKSTAKAVDTTHSGTAESDRSEASAPALPREPEARGPRAAIPPATAVPKATVRVALAVSPWGEVYVDGQRKGASPPMKELTLTPGIYAIEIRNSTFPPYRESIDLRSSTKAKITHKFQ